MQYDFSAKNRKWWEIHMTSLQISSCSQLQDKLTAVYLEHNTPLLNCQQISSTSLMPYADSVFAVHMPQCETEVVYGGWMQLA